MEIQFSYKKRDIEKFVTELHDILNDSNFDSDKDFTLNIKSKPEVKIFEREAYTVVKGKQVKYIETYFACENVENDDKEYTNASMMNENLRRARNEYRKMCRLLLPDEIVSIRSKYGLSQVDLAKILGWGDITIARYETKAIQDQTYDNILIDIKDNPKKFLEYYYQKLEKFDSCKREVIESNINKPELFIKH